jgi:Zn-finger nucleic acid-binding protein
VSKTFADTAKVHLLRCDLAVVSKPTATSEPDCQADKPVFDQKTLACDAGRPGPDRSPEELPMLCPTCDNVNLAMTDRQGIEIDYCPKCRGIWLDRGELDRLIERAEQSAHASSQPAPAHNAPVQHARSHDGRDYPRHSGDRDAHAHGHRHKRPKSLLGELFDF